MDELHRKDQQLNEETGAEYDLEEIMREFGAEPEEPETAEPVPEPETVLTQAEQPPCEEELPEEDDLGEEEFFEEESEAEDYDGDEEPVPERNAPLFRRRERAPEPAPMDPEEAAEVYAGQCLRLRFCSIFAWLVMILSAAVSVVACNPQWSVSAYLPVKAANAAVLLSLLVHLGLSLPVLRSSISALLQGKFTAQLLGVLAAVLTAVRGCLELDGTELCLASAASLVLTVGLWSHYLLCMAKLRTIKGILNMEHPSSVCRAEHSRGGKPCLYRADADPSDFMTDLEQQPRAERAMHTVSAVLLALSLAVGTVLHVRGGRDLLWTWNILLLGICPLGGMLAYGRAFHMAAKRLKAANAAVPGWNGAKKLSGSVGLVITDTDVFSRKSVSMNGIKIMEEMTSTAQALRYALVLLENSGAEGLIDLFRAALPEGMQREELPLNDFRTYPFGGLSGELGGDVIRLGSFGFMKSMGVFIPEDAVKPYALYLSVGSRAAASFVLHYSREDAAAKSFARLLGESRLTPVLASRDMQITPEMLQKFYGVPEDVLEFPTMFDRAQLASLSQPQKQGAFLGRAAFLPMTYTVITARQLHRGTASAITVSVLGALLGFFLMSLLALVDATNAVTALNLLLFYALWLLPVGLITGMIGKS